MLKRFCKLFVIIMPMVAILFTTLSCYLEEPKIATISNSVTYYKINPDAILEALRQNRTDEFILEDSTPEAEILVFGKPVPWRQIDYLRIAQALFEHRWGGSVEEWNLGNMVFDLSCSDVGIGFQEAEFLYYGFVYENGEKLLVKRRLHIDPQRYFARVSEEKLYPAVNTSKPIDLAKVKVSADEAMQIAEKEGGSEIRSAVENVCDIFLIIDPAAMYGGWQAQYEQFSDGNFERIFRIHIDPRNAKFKVIYP